MITNSKKVLERFADHFLLILYNKNIESYSKVGQ
ncbi:hypothetical protein ABSA28_00193 [Candidatus Hepatincolaceae symbiont of Richtersius coronifer]